MIYIVYGAICSGKSTYVKNNKKWKDIVFDYDDIAKALTGKKRPKGKELIDTILNVRVRLISDYRKGKIKDLWIITTNLEQVKKECIGLDVKELQVWLNNHGYTIALTGPGSKGNETNKFGSLTKKAVIAFQKANGLTPDGIVGPKTLEKMK